LFRLRRQVEMTADPKLIELLREVSLYPAPPGPPVAATGLQHAVAVPFRVRVGDDVLSFLSTTTIFGTPVDVILSELALELFFPADDETAASVRRMAGSAADVTS
jgi:hypothetical protein